MGVKIIEDVRGGGALKGTFTEVAVARRFHVSGLPGPDYALAFQGAQAVDSTSGFAIPVLGTPHPYEPLAIVANIDVDVDRGANTAYVKCTYEYKTVGSSQGFLESYSGSFFEYESHCDAAGNLATVNYTPTGKAASPPLLAKLKLKALTSNLQFEFETSTSPRSIATAAAGCINNAPWLGYGVRTVLCLPPCGSTKDGIVWRVRYAFSFLPFTWDQWQVYPDHTGGVPPDAAPIAPSLTDPTIMSGNGWARFTVYPQADFSTLFPGVK